MLSIRNISFGYPSQIKPDFVVKNVSFDIERGEFISLIGPNGSGKTTLLRLIDKIFLPSKGDIFLFNKNIRSLRRSEIAKRIGFVPQDGSIIFPFTVLEIVLMGRSPHLKGLGFENKHDLDIAFQMMELADVAHLAYKSVTAISGGERQRAFIARALAQEPEIILLDEPNAHLDISHQVDIFDIIKALNREKHITVVSVSHDLNLVSTYSDRIVLLEHGSVYAIGTPADVLTEKNVRTVYRANILVDTNPVTSSPRVTLLPRNGDGQRQMEDARTAAKDQDQGVPAHSKNPGRDRRRFLLSIAIVSEILTYGLLAYIRYRNQGLSLSAFDLTKTGNLISTGFLILMMASICAHTIRPKLSDLQSRWLMTLSVLSLFLLGLSVFPDRDLKVTIFATITLIKSYEFAYSLILNVRTGQFRLFTSKRTKPANLLGKLASPLLAIAVTGVLVSFSIIYALLYKDDTNKYVLSQSIKADAAVILGAAVWHGNRPSPIFRERINKGYELLRSGVVPVLVLTGGNAYGEIPEAGIARRELLKMGARDSQLIVESASSSTIEQIVYIRNELVAKRNLHRFIIVSNHFHLRRAIDMCNFNNISADAVACHDPLNRDKQILFVLRDGVALIFYWLFGV
jgi:iron complex transport system ATP-binding protein